MKLHTFLDLVICQQALCGELDTGQRSRRTALKAAALLWAS